MYSNINKNFENEENIQKISKSKNGPRKNILKRFSSDLSNENENCQSLSDMDLSELCDGKIQMDNNINNFNANSIIELGNNIKKIGEFSFDIFEMKKICKEKTMQHIAYEILSNFSFFDYLIDERKLKNFMKEIAGNYGPNNPYHNEIHAADVMQTMYVIMTKGKMQEVRGFFFFNFFL